jgi:hypothetical protein
VFSYGFVIGWARVQMKSALSEHFDILETNLREEGRKILFTFRKK